MAVEGTQSDVFQQLGFSYFQLTDYSSKQFTATCVRRTPPADLAHAQTDIGSSQHFGVDDMGLYQHLVCTLPPLPEYCSRSAQSDGEMAYFWEARRELRWSIARVLFIVVSSCLR